MKPTVISADVLFEDHRSVLRYKDKVQEHHHLPMKKEVV